LGRLTSHHLIRRLPARSSFRASLRTTLQALGVRVCAALPRLRASCVAAGRDATHPPPHGLGRRLACRRLFAASGFRGAGAFWCVRGIYLGLGAFVHRMSRHLSTTPPLPLTRTTHGSACLSGFLPGLACAGCRRLLRLSLQVRCHSCRLRPHGSLPYPHFRISRSCLAAHYQPLIHCSLIQAVLSPICHLFLSLLS
jgi:hypothetical protein